MWQTPLFEGTMCLFSFKKRKLIFRVADAIKGWSVSLFSLLDFSGRILNSRVKFKSKFQQLAIVVHHAIAHQHTDLVDAHRSLDALKVFYFVE